MIIGRIWSLNKPRKWDKVKLLCFKKFCGSTNRKIIWTRVYNWDIKYSE